MVIGYESFRNLTQDYTRPNKKTGKIPANQTAKKKLVALQPEFRKYLQDPGADLVICDEGHKLKNVESEISKTMVCSILLFLTAIFKTLINTIVFSR